VNDVKKLIENMKNKNVPPVVVWGPGQIGDKRVIEPLINALKDDDTEVRLG
jgi:HEAT repeat protein